MRVRTSYVTRHVAATPGSAVNGVAANMSKAAQRVCRQLQQGFRQFSSSEKPMLTIPELVSAAAPTPKEVFPSDSNMGIATPELVLPPIKVTNSKSALFMGKGADTLAHTALKRNLYAPHDIFAVLKRGLVRNFQYPHSLGSHPIADHHSNTAYNNVRHWIDHQTDSIDVYLLGGTTKLIASPNPNPNNIKEKPSLDRVTKLTKDCHHMDIESYNAITRTVLANAGGRLAGPKINTVNVISDIPVDESSVTGHDLTLRFCGSGPFYTSPNDLSIDQIRELSKQEHVSLDGLFLTPPSQQSHNPNHQIVWSNKMATQKLCNYLITLDLTVRSEIQELNDPVQLPLNRSTLDLSKIISGHLSNTPLQHNEALVLAGEPTISDTSKFSSNSYGGRTTDLTTRLAIDLPAGYHIMMFATDLDDGITPDGQSLIGMSARSSIHNTHLPELETALQTGNTLSTASRIGSALFNDQLNLDTSEKLFGLNAGNLLVITTI